MIANLSKRLVYACLLSTQLLAYSTAFAKSGGAIAGGGGDASEERVSEIRADILKWINKGGAKALVLPSSISYSEYESKMKEILQPQKVVVGFVEQDDKTNPELQVNVDGMPKTCRGFISEVDSKHHILCNISRFQNTAEAEQYKLIHHEYAGLVNVENNDEAASDYEVSSQLTAFLSRQTVLRLAVKGNTTNPGERKKSIVEVTTIKDMGKKGMLYTFTVVNTEDVAMVQIENIYGNCNLPNQILLKEENLSLTFLCATGRDPFMYFSDVKVQYNDGSISAGTFNRPYNEKITEGHIVKMNYVLKDESSEVYHGNRTHTVTTRLFGASYKVSAKDLVDYRGVQFDDGDSFISENAEELASYINSKKHDFKISFRDKYVDDNKFCTVLGCLINKKKKVEGEVELIFFAGKKIDSPTLFLMKKGDITEYVENSTPYKVFIDNKAVR